jgi:hypothetical protein
MLLSVAARTLTALKKHLIGVRVDLAAVSPTQLKEVVRMAWRHMAPREVAADHERNR